jgi:hypothetical protein
MDLYKWLWSHIGGRPWTYIIRDFYHEVEFVVILGMLALGYYLARRVSLHDFVSILVVLAAGYLLGHLFWGTRYIPGQRNHGNHYNPRRESRLGKGPPSLTKGKGESQ